MATRELTDLVRAHGIVIPVRALNAADKARIPYWAAGAFLMQETNGGWNIYGHDKIVRPDGIIIPRPMCRPSGTNLVVTPENYQFYLGERNAFKDDPRIGYRNQGVGPMQVTHWSLQDACDELGRSLVATGRISGGCWDPYTNMLFAFTYIMEKRAKGYTWHQVARIYNGKESYALQMDKRFAEWRGITGGR